MNSKKKYVVECSVVIREVVDSGALTGAKGPVLQSFSFTSAQVSVRQAQEKKQRYVVALVATAALCGDASEYMVERLRALRR